MSRLHWRRYTRPGSQPWSVAQVGTGPMSFHIFIQDNGEGWYNWCVTRDSEDFLMESPDRIDGGNASYREAEESSELIALSAVEAMAASFGLTFREIH